MSLPVVTFQLIGTQKGVLEVASGSTVGVIFSAAEIRDVSQKTGNTTRTLSFANTDNNHKLFGMLFDVNTVEGTFNPALAVKGILLEDGVPIIQNAVLQLTKVKKRQPNANNEQLRPYEGIVKDETAAFFTALGSKELTDIKYTDLDHTYTGANVVASFAHDQSDGYKYSMPLTASNVLNLQEFRPAIYLKTYFDRIFSTNGFSYKWDDMNDNETRFDKFIVPYNGDVPKVRQEVLDFLRVEAVKMSVQTITQTPTTGLAASIPPTPILINTEISDPSGSYDPFLSAYTAPIYNLGGGFLSFKLNVSWTLELVNSSGATAYMVGNVAKYKPLMSLGKAPSYNNVSSGSLNGASLINVFTALGNTTALPAGTTVLKDSYSTVELASNLTTLGEIYRIGTAVEQVGITFNPATWRNAPTSTATEVPVSVRLKINTIQMIIQPSMSEIAYNQKINMSDFVPLKTKQSDVIKSIFTGLNLMVETDAFDSNKLVIKGRDKYFDEGTQKDWTQKLDKNKEQDLIFLPSITAKKIELTYKEDKDAPNKDYKDATNEIYGQVDFTFDSEHVKGTDKKELIFSPTPVTENSFGAIVPMLTANPKSNIRLLYDGGNFTCNTYTIVDYINAAGVAVGTTKTDYPLFSHFDKPVNPTFDLNFAICDYYYYPIGAKTNNNLYNLKWRRTIAQINTGKMFVGYFNLTKKDISTLKLSDKIFVENAWFNINKIEYNAGNRTSSKVELLTVDTEVDFVPYNTGSPTFPPIGDDKLEAVGFVISEGQQTGNVNLSEKEVILSGVNNQAGQDAEGIIVGDNNTMSAKGMVVGNGITLTENGIGTEFIQSEKAKFTEDVTIDGTLISEKFEGKVKQIPTDIGKTGESNLYAQTTDATFTKAIPAEGENFGIESGTAYGCTINVVGLVSSKEAVFFRATALIVNDAGTTALIGSPVIENLYNSFTADLKITADNVNDALLIEVQGDAGLTVNWSVNVKYLQVK